LDGITELIERTRRAKEEWRERERNRPFEEKLRMLQELMQASYTAERRKGYLAGSALKSVAPRGTRRR
jgi:hypothetical protein